jgi:hypothetical protein
MSAGAALPTALLAASREPAAAPAPMLRTRAAARTLFDGVDANSVASGTLSAEV